MDPEGSLPHSHVPATCPYSEPAQSSPYPHIPLPEDPCHHGMARPQVGDGGTVSSMEGSCENIE